MPAPVFLSADELLPHFRAAGLSLRELVQAVLGCQPVNDQGASVRWPAASELRVRHLVHQPVVGPQGPGQAAVLGFSVMAMLVAEKAVNSVLFDRRHENLRVEMNRAQIEQVYRAVVRFVEPGLDLRVVELLCREPNLRGFFDSYAEGGPDEFEQELRANPLANAKRPLVRLVDEPFLGYRLTGWQQRLAEQADAGERVVDVHGMLTSAAGRASPVLQGGEEVKHMQGEQFAHARLRYFQLPPGTQPRDLVFLLDAYDAQGLELGVALRQAIEHGQLPAHQLEEGFALLQLQAWEVRADRRGQGLGWQFLRQLLSVATKGLRPQPRRLVCSVKPGQFVYPLRGYPAELQLEALDAVTAIQGYLDQHRPQDALRSLKGTEVLYLGADERATGPDFAQLQLLAEQKRPRG